MQQSIHCLCSPVNATIIVPGSKSITNRALLLAALAEGVSTLHGIQVSEDTMTMIHALKSLGVRIQVDPAAQSCVVMGSLGQFPNAETDLWCARSGTVARFLIAACALRSGGRYCFDGSEQLRKRPLAKLLHILHHQGVTILPNEATQQLPLTLVSPASLAGGEIVLDNPRNRLVTSQFLSALLMIAPYARLPFTFHMTCPIVSQPYIEMTCALMAAFGVQVHQIYQGRLTVPIPQSYAACDYYIEPDWSTASYFFAAAAITSGTVTILGLQYVKSKQPDCQFLLILKKMGCQVIQCEQNHAITVMGPARLSGIKIDMRDCSDLFPTLAAIAPFATSEVTIFNIGHTRYKESDRMTTMAAGLMAMGATVVRGPDWMTIYPSALRGQMIHCAEDHRIAMAFAIAGLKISGIILDDISCINKTCPEFFTILRKLAQPYADYTIEQAVEEKACS